jgi:large subunit ribosomal protein L10
LAISREKKEQIVAELADLLTCSQAVVLTDYRGLTVTDIGRLRGQLRDRGARFMVAKNTLIGLALQRTGRPVPEALLEGPTGLAFLFDDIAGASKVINDFVRDSKVLTIKGSILGTSLINAEGTADLARLPSREMLRGQLLGALQSPMAGLVGVLTAPMRELVFVLQARADQLKQSAPEHLISS